MQKSFYSISVSDLFDLFGRLALNNRIFVPYDYKDKFVFAPFDPAKEQSIQLGGIRQTQPFKSFLNPARQLLIDSRAGGPARERILGREEREEKPVIVAGVKQCDLNSLILQDYVFLKCDYEDPFYAFHRNNTLIISCDCTLPKETCFCLAMSGQPYAKEYFDINLSPMGDFFLVEVGSSKGESIINNYKTFFKEAKERDLNRRDNDRENVSGQVREFIKKRGTPDTTLINGTMKKQYNTLAMWQDHSSTCVECGACNLVCPTCHCFQLFDEKTQQKIGRGRVWDACLYKTFARVAGGANPRKHLYERLRNRFDKKFAFFPEVLNYFACTGCGRCIEACPGDIDIREVLKGMVSSAWNKPPHNGS